MSADVCMGLLPKRHLPTCLSAQWIDISSPSKLSQGKFALTMTAVVAALLLNLAEKEKAMDPNPTNPNIPEPSEPSSESASENLEPSLTPSEAPSPPTDESDSTAPGSDSPPTQDATEVNETLDDDAPEELKKLEADAVAKNNAAAAALDAFSEAVDDHLVNEDEVGAVEFRETGEVPKETQDVSVTCHKCGHSKKTMVTRKQFEKQAESGEQPKFQTKCQFCNYDSTYVLTGDGTKTIA